MKLNINMQQKIVSALLACFIILYVIGQFCTVVKIASSCFFILFCFFTLLFICATKKIKFNSGISNYYFFTGLLVWCLVGLSNGYSETVYSEALAFFSLWGAWKCVKIAYDFGLIDVHRMTKCIYWSMMLWFIEYIALIAGLISGALSQNMIYSLLSEWSEGHFGSEPETLAIGFLGIMPRLCVGVNIIPLLVLLIIIYKNKKVDTPAMILGFVYVLIDYGRLDMFVYACSIVLSLYYSFSIVKLKKIITVVFVFISGILLFLVFNNDIELAYDGIVDAFTSDRVGRSDDTRWVSYVYLKDGIIDKPILGHGMGSYLSEQIRNDDKWQYELQTLAFVYQLGFVGTLLIIINFIINTYFSMYRSTKYKRILPFIFFIWIVHASIQGGVYINGKVILPVIFILLAKQKE